MTTVLVLFHTWNILAKTSGFKSILVLLWEEHPGQGTHSRYVTNWAICACVSFFAIFSFWYFLSCFFFCLFVCLSPYSRIAVRVKCSLRQEACSSTYHASSWRAKLKSVVERIITYINNLQRNKFWCRKLNQSHAQFWIHTTTIIMTIQNKFLACSLYYRSCNNL